MKKTTKKGPSKASQKKAAKDLDVKPSKGGAVRGGVPLWKLGYSRRLAT